MTTPTATVNASEESIRLGDLAVRFLLTGADTNGNASIFEVMVPAGQNIPAPAHKNDAYEEVLYGIEGVVTWTIDGKPHEVGPGQAVCIPRGAVHRFDNFGDKDARQLVIITPAVMGPAYFRETREVLKAAAETGTPPDRNRMAEIFRQNGMTIAAPPVHQ
jgi:quercetin dioxygenase-like cupin family protein